MKAVVTYKIRFQGTAEFTVLDLKNAKNWEAWNGFDYTKEGIARLLWDWSTETNNLVSGDTEVEIA